MRIGLSFAKRAPLVGRFSIAVDDDVVAHTEELKTVGVSFGGSLRLGRDDGSPVSGSYPAPSHFEGRLGTVTVRLGDDAEPVTIPDLID